MEQQDVLAAIYALYHDAQNRFNADRYLTAFQADQRAWDFSLAILAQPLRADSPEVHFFAAQTLNTKAKRDWRQRAEHLATVQQTVQILHRALSEGWTQAITLQIAMSLASMAVGSLPDEWPSCVLDICSWFAQFGGATIQLMTLLPDALDSCVESYQAMERRKMILTTSWTDSVHALVASAMRNAMEAGQWAVATSAVECATAWVQLDVRTRQLVRPRTPVATRATCVQVPQAQLLILTCEAIKHLSSAASTQVRCGVDAASCETRAALQHLHRMSVDVVPSPVAWLNRLTAHLRIWQLDGKQAAAHVNCFEKAVELLADAMSSWVPGNAQQTNDFSELFGASRPRSGILHFTTRLSMATLHPVHRCLLPLQRWAHPSPR
jgi:hypothetical protein